MKTEESTSVEISEIEFRRMLHLRAIEWVNWPAFLSPLFLPILFIFMYWWAALLGLVVVEVIWSFVRYQIHDFRSASSLAVWVSLGQWPIALVSCIVLLFERRFGVAALAALWPLICGFVCIPGKIGIAEANFAREVGYIKDDSME